MGKGLIEHERVGLLNSGGTRGLHQCQADGLPREMPVNGLDAAQPQQQHGNGGKQKFNGTLAGLEPKGRMVAAHERQCAAAQA